MKKNYDFDWNVAADPATDSGDYLHDVVSAEVDESLYPQSTCEGYVGRF